MSRDAMSSRAHQVCSESSRAVVDMLHHLERHGLLHQLSSDVIHILSLATLFQGMYGPLCEVSAKTSLRLERPRSEHFADGQSGL